MKHVASIWDRENLFAWMVQPPFVTSPRTPVERAAMLAALGFQRSTFMVMSGHTADDLEAELDALDDEGIVLVGLRVTVEPDHPALDAILRVVAERAQPSLWVIQSRLPSETDANLASLSHQQRVQREADRIERYQEHADPRGLGVALYNHNAWFGRIDHEIAILDELEHRGSPAAGLVYNFSHARDDDRDDSVGFARLWTQMAPRTLAVNITGMRWEGELAYPSQGDAELDMMRVIQESGWHGPIGLIGEMGGDAKGVLTDYLRGLNWLAAELAAPGSGGPRPFTER